MRCFLDTIGHIICFRWLDGTSNSGITKSYSADHNHRGTSFNHSDTFSNDFSYDNCDTYDYCICIFYYCDNYFLSHDLRDIYNFLIFCFICIIFI